MDRRQFLVSGALAAALGGLPASIARALDIPANSATGTVMDVEHVVILTQENRSFDHYFGTLNGVRGFGDRFPIPVSPDATIWSQPNTHGGVAIAPFMLNTTQHFEHMRVTGTPHAFPDAQAAWDNGRMSAWPKAKGNHSLGYFTRADIPFQFAMAEAFTLCDAYHCSMHAGTNPNRTYLWTGTNDPLAKGHGPVIDNGYDHLSADPAGHGGYEWATYPERLTSAGVSWQIYQDMADNFTDNPLAGFKLYRFADKAKDGPLANLAQKALRTRDLNLLKADVLAGTLPQVSWIIATAEGSEHPGPSSPAQGADYTAKVLDALTANPQVWAKTVLLINFDENDGFFDHVPPPAPPGVAAKQSFGESQVNSTGEYHVQNDKWQDRPYGLGPRVPMYVISPWSKGGFVNSQVFDHTSVIRFLETRFGVHEPNISAWRRSVCGDLLTCFDFKNPNRDDFFQHFPETKILADRARALPGTTTPPTPAKLEIPVQEKGQRPARALPYQLSASLGADVRPAMNLANNSPLAVVFHVYDVLQLDHPPLRHTVKSGGTVSAELASQMGIYNHVLLGPGGFSRHFRGEGPCPLTITAAEADGRVTFTLDNPGAAKVRVTLADEAYGQPSQAVTVAARNTQTVAFDLSRSHNWYDVSICGDGFAQRFAGHVETGSASFSDPALGGPATMTPWKPVVA